jgi:DNA-binding LacI/PurR family transcriptional regulator
LVDVAERAGVSMKTVSNVVNGAPNVAPALRARVQAALDELGYRPNLTARRLATGRTGMIALAIPEIDHPYFAELSRQIAERATAHGYRVIVEQTLSDHAAEEAVLADREAGLVDGVIFHPVRMTTMEIGRLRADTPLVLLGESATPLTTDLVLIDNVLAATDSTSHLIALGRRRIAFLGVVEHDPTGATNRRLIGYQQALIDAGIEADSGLLLPVADFSAEAAEAAVVTAIDRGLSFDGVLCRDDKFALGALKALHRAGRAVPADVAVIGWDNTAIGSYTSPTLSSVSPDKRAIAEVALELLDERIGGYRGPGRHRVVGHSIVARESAPAALP